MDNELGLFNKAGDLYQKVGNVSAAVDVWERAANRYSENGFPNNAIALCNKILRASPGRTPVYLKLAKLMTERGFVAEAKRNLLEYAQRMQNAGKVEDAFRALKEFADLSPNNEEIRLLLAEQLKQAARTDEAREQLEKLYSEMDGGESGKARSTMDRMKAIDPEFEASGKAGAAAASKAKRGDLVFIDLDAADESAEDVEADVAVEPEPVEGLTPAAAEPDQEVVSDAAGLEIETTSLADDYDDEPAAAPALEIETTSLADDYDTEDLVTESLVEDDTVQTEDIPALEIETTSLVEGEPAAVDEDAESRPVDGLPVARESSEYLVSDLPDDDAAPLIESADDLEIDLEVEAPAAEVPAADLDAPAPDIELASLDIDIEMDEPAEPEAAPAAVADEVPEIDLGGLDLDLAEEEAPEPAPAADELQDLDLDLAPADASATEDVAVEDDVSLDLAEDVSLDLGEVVEAEPTVAEEPASLGVAELESMVADDPGDPKLHRQLAEALMEAGDRERGLEELDIALGMYEASEEWSRAEGLVDEAIRLEPNSVRHHQKRVELSFRRNDKSRLVDAYLGLADALFRLGNTDRARAVYQRVLEHDAENDAARTALETLEPAPSEAAPAAEPEAAPAAAANDGDYVDLGALLLDDEPQLKDTRMRIEEEEPTGDEERDFDEMLSAFKKGIEENVADEDWQAHYDLGVAFKEMGLLDEAIAEFQKALRASEGRLRTAEALGTAFFEKGQYSVAGTVLRRGIDSEPGSDESKIGLLYWLARCEEGQGRAAEALTIYQRVFAVDIQFQDVQERVQQLSQSGG